MTPIKYIIFFYLTLNSIGCQQVHERESRKSTHPSDSSTVTIEKTKTVNNEIPENAYLSIDSSWAVELFAQEGQLERIKIFSTKQEPLEKVVILPKDIIGGIDSNAPLFPNDTSMQFSSIGSTATGFYSITIYNSGNYTFSHHSIASPPMRLLDPKPSIEDIIDQAEPDRPQPMKRHTVVDNGNKITFSYAYFDPGPPDIGCGESSESWSLSIYTDEEKFHLKDEELKALSFSYHGSGGNFFENASSITSGTISGEKSKDNNWYLHLDILIQTSSFMGDREKRIQFAGIFDKN